MLLIKHNHQECHLFHTSLILLGNLQNPMLQSRNARAHTLNARRLDNRHDHAFTDRLYRLHDAPRIDNHAVAKGASTVFVLAALPAGNHIALILDRARAHEQFPMRLPCGLCKRGNVDPSKHITRRTVEFRKAHIVANRLTDASPRTVPHHRCSRRLARHDGGGFVVVFQAILKTK